MSSQTTYTKKELAELEREKREYAELQRIEAWEAKEDKKEAQRRKQAAEDWKKKQALDALGDLRKVPSLSEIIACLNSEALLSDEERPSQAEGGRLGKDERVDLRVSQDLTNPRKKGKSLCIPSGKKTRPTRTKTLVWKDLCQRMSKEKMKRKRTI